MIQFEFQSFVSNSNVQMQEKNESKNQIVRDGNGTVFLH